MEIDKEIDLNKKMDHLYNFCVFHMKIVTPSGNSITSLPIPVPRSGHRMVFYKGNMYAFGGYSPRDQSSNVDIVTDELENRRLFRELWKFNVATKTWTYLETDGTMPMELASHAVALADNCMVVYGGTGLPFGHSSSNSAHLCNLDALEWITLSTQGDKPQPLYGQAVAIQDHKLYVVGGTTGYDYTISVHCLDLQSKEWTRLDNKKKQAVIPSSRYRHEIALFEDKIFVFGGGTVSESFSLKKVPTFSLTEKTWSVTVTSTNSGFPRARRCHGSVQIGSDVFICGGHDGESIFSDIWRINLKELRWTKLAVELPVPLYFHAVTVSPEGQLFTFGGVTNIEEEIRTNTVYSIWLKIPSLSDMCWEAILCYIPNIGLLDKQTLYKLGVPLKYIELIEFYSEKRKRIQVPFVF